MRALLTVTLTVTVAATAVSACTNKITADLTVDGQKLEPTGCKSGQPLGFAGVDLIEKSGRKLRLVADPSGQALAILFTADGAQAAELGRCGPMTLATQNSTVNDVRNVKGNATLACESEGHSVKGTVSFENCH